MDLKRKKSKTKRWDRYEQKKTRPPLKLHSLTTNQGQILLQKPFTLSGNEASIAQFIVNKIRKTLYKRFVSLTVLDSATLLADLRYHTYNKPSPNPIP